MRHASCLEAALWLESEGCSVFPLCPKDKRPLAPLLPGGKWEQFQHRRATREEITRWFTERPDANLALVCGSISGIVAVDVDGPGGQEWFKANMTTHKPNLFQFTSSKNKFHVFYRHPGEDIRIPPSVKLLNSEIDVRGDGSYVVFSPSIHPSGHKYELRELEGFTGMNSLVPLPDLKLRENPDRTYSLADEQSEPNHCEETQIIPQGERNNAITSYCAAQYAKGLDIEDVVALARARNTAYCRPPLTMKEVDTIARSMGKTHCLRNPEAVNAGGVALWLEKIHGTFNIADIYRDLCVKRPEARATIRKQLHELEAKGEIEPALDKAGFYRKRDHSLEIIDPFVEDEPKIEGFWLPFSLGYRCEIRQKNIIVIAGETNSGKTSMLFNIANANRNNFDINYLTSEMTPGEIQSRINYFNNQWEWERIRFVNRTANFYDALMPEAVNIIDFLEIYDDFSKVGAEIKKIFDALTTGIAIVAIQKKKGEIYGRGAEFSLEKARLALSLFTHGHLPDGIIGSCLVTKCKNFISGKNPEGRERFYTLKEGYRYDQGDIPDMPEFISGWRYWKEKDRNDQISAIKDYCRMKSEQADSLIHDRDFYEGVEGWDNP